MAVCLGFRRTQKVARTEVCLCSGVSTTTHVLRKNLFVSLQSNCKYGRVLKLGR